MYIIFFLISFGASIIGAICGIGGGIIIKPVMDAFGLLSVSMINFLSGCTVLAMTCYSVARAKLAKEKAIDAKIATPLGIGAALGGLIGKELFSYVAALFDNANTAGALQAGVLGVITVGTLLYTLNKERIHTYRVRNIFACLFIGMMLGIFSSFLGIGGGPINLVVLYFFFTMQTKEAAQNSLYIILFSQITATVRSLFTMDLAQISALLLGGMILSGILGGVLGRVINKKIDARMVDRLFIALMVVIIGINIYNVFKFLAI
ncbi:MAG: sulfite exporter TauE/SafE family protein [Erysipelotrichaceae bacterium]|nr:sulfite exporter TauE/SafE family protein [Erysipelotrichaceae bacterium]